MVIAGDALAFRLLCLPFRLFAGGPLGPGTQPFSWIGIRDVVALYDHAVRDDTIAGPVNLVGPEAPTQAEVAERLARLLGRPSWLRVPAPLLRLVLWGQADLFLHGRQAAPKTALDAGYAFEDRTFADAAAWALRPRGRAA
jgi:NAD dependent epimerase/dehydratase family enzyme